MQVIKGNKKEEQQQTHQPQVAVKRNNASGLSNKDNMKIKLNATERRVNIVPILKKRVKQVIERAQTMDITALR